MTGSFDTTARVIFIVLKNKINPRYGILVLVNVYMYLMNILGRYQVLNLNLLENIVLLDQSIGKILNQLHSDKLYRTCKIWDISTGKCVETLRGHVDEVLDLCFNSTGTMLVTASADGTARVYNVNTGACITALTG